MCDCSGNRKPAARQAQAVQDQAQIVVRLPPPDLNRQRAQAGQARAARLADLDLDAATGPALRQELLDADAAVSSEILKYMPYRQDMINKLRS